MDKDTFFIKKTFQLAKKKEGFTSPNPLVAAVITKSDRIISSGYHKKAGSAHAEVIAIKNAKENLKNSTLYVNLEPCFHFGKTPPCVDEIIKSGIKRVVISNIDPNPRVSGKSIQKLKKFGIEVKVGVCEKEGERLNEVFFKNMRYSLPFVVAKVAQSLDGKIATRLGFSKWITSEKSRIYSKQLRDKYDAVLVGVNTIIKDNPKLNGIKKIPYKIVLDKDLVIPKKSYVFNTHRDKLILVTSTKNREQTKKIPKPIKVILAKQSNEKFLLKELLKTLYSLGINSIFVEGGSFTLGSFFDEKLVDKIYFFIAPKIIGGSLSLSSIGGLGCKSLKDCIEVNDLSLTKVGDDILVSGYPVYK